MAADILQIYAQPFEHQEAWICGDREGLTKLRDALNIVLDTDAPASAHSYCVDGEGYATVILPVDGETLLDVMLPYTEFEGVLRTKGPFNLLSKEKYRELVKL